MTHRTGVRAFALGLVVVSAATLAPAYADTPAAWEPEPHVPVLDFLLVLFLIPLGIAAVISLLVLLPSMIRSRSYEPGEAWGTENVWFGGPRKGLAAAPETRAIEDHATAEQGGASAEW